MIGEYLTTEEVAEKYKVTTGWVSHLCLTGDLKAKKISGLWFIKLEDIPKKMFPKNKLINHDEQ